MIEERYKEKRAALVREFWFLKSKHCRLSAKARVRKIAELDLENKDIPIEKTLERFNYDKL